MKFTMSTHDRADYLVDRYSERKESGGALMKRVNLAAPTERDRHRLPLVRCRTKRLIRFQMLPRRFAARYFSRP